MFFAESGSLHCIENVGSDKAELIVSFRHERPKDFALKASFGAMRNAVLGNTYDLNSEVFPLFRIPHLRSIL